MTATAFQNAAVAQEVVDERRRSIPYAADQLAILLDLVRYFRPDPQAILDLGCGDGILARTLLAVYPQARAVLIDHSAPMLARAREQMAGYGGQAEIVLADLTESLGAYAEPGSIDVAASGYAIHHLPDARKRSLYAEVYTALAPGGLFVNIEHVAPASARLESLWDELLIDRLVANTGKPRGVAASEYRARPDKANNILAPLETQLGWLREIGFEEVDCYFKHLELAVFGGVKGSG